MRWRIEYYNPHFEDTKIKRVSGKYFFLCAILLLSLQFSTPIYSKTGIRMLTLDEAIAIAKQHSTQAQLAQFAYMGQYWNYRSYKAELLPSLNTNAGLLNYDRSMVEVRDPETGEISYVENNSLSNDLTLSIEQNIPFSGGRLSLSSNLSRLDQFDYNRTIYYSNPLTLNYTQPLLAFNTLKWKKKTAPLEYENSKRKYLETIQQITLQTAQLFFSVLSSQTNYKKSIENHEDRKRLFRIANKRYNLGTTTRSEILQLELSLLNAEMSITASKLNLETQLLYLCSFLGIKEYFIIELIQPQDVPKVELNFDNVLEKVFENSTHTANRKLKLLESRKALAQAKSSVGLQADFKANIGLSKTGENFIESYINLIDREIVGITLRMPIFDWGLGKGKIKMAQADLDITKKEIEQDEIEFIQDIKTKVFRFNNQGQQCKISIRAQDIAAERYEITKKRFENGTVTVTDLNTAQKEFDDAQDQYISQLGIYWSAYYELQKIALYDFIHKIDISADFEALVK